MNIKNIMKTVEIRDKLFKALKDYGAVKWYKSKHDSFYIKFKDTRLGSIRISDHKGRTKYNYTYELYSDSETLLNDFYNTINSIKENANNLYLFNKDNYVAFIDNKWVWLQNYSDWKNFILKKEIPENYTEIKRIKHIYD